MKDIKSYVIGFLTCACMFLVMGQTKGDSQIGRYQGYSVLNGNHLNADPILYMVDTVNGQTFRATYSKRKGHQWVGATLQMN